MPTLTIAQIAELAGLEPDSSPAKVSGGPQVSRVSAIGDATPDALVFAQDEPSLAAALASNAGIILAPRKLDLSKAVRGKYYDRMRERTNIVLLAPDLMAAFPDSDAVNDALRKYQALTAAKRA